MTCDDRLRALQTWLDQVTPTWSGQLLATAGDASARRYFRIHLAGQTRIVMDAPPALIDCRPFVTIAARLADLGLWVPRVHAQDLDCGFLLLDDLGERHFADVLDDQSADELYALAFAALRVIQREADPVDAKLPPYDEILLRRELEIFSTWFLRRSLGLNLNTKQLEQLANAFDFLCEQALLQPRCWVYRDYHSRNLMIGPEQQVGLLDFQDALHGPITYDLVSLLRDCYIDWPDQRVQDWMEHYYRLIAEDALPGLPSQNEFARGFDLCGVQRHLKALGLFSRLHMRDRKDRYLADIPRTVGYVISVSRRYRPLFGLAEMLEKHAVGPFT